MKWGVVRNILVTLTAAWLSAAPVGAEPGTAPSAVAPSFDCSKAAAGVEVLICKDPELAEADALMARMFAAVKVSAWGKGASGEAATQREWLKDRNSCHEKDGSADKSCLLAAYNERNQQLAVAALFGEPDAALATLRKLDPEAAPMYEAITIYANEAVGTNWSRPALAPKRSRIIGLLEPYFAAFRSNSDYVYGWSILTGDHINSPADALRSEEKFAEFLRINSAYLGGDPIPRKMPCAAILKHPKLLDATNAAFGSTLDKFIMESDCPETLAPLPRLDALVHGVWALWPECDGSIRFSGYRNFWVSNVEGARLATRAEILSFTRSKASRGGVSIPRRRGLPAKLVADAIAELATYYQAYQGVSAKDALTYATSAVRDIAMDQQECL